MNARSSGIAKRKGSVRDRVLAMLDEGVARSKIIDALCDDGASLSTVMAYLHQFAEGNDAWITAAKTACEAHLADLMRFHGHTGAN